MKRLLLCLSAGILTAIILAQLYTRFLHPEITFFRKADAICTLHEQNLRAAGHHCCILAGGSETKASLSPTVMMEEAGIAAVNAATAAGFGLESNASIGINHLQSGDTLVLSLISAQEDSIQASDAGLKLAWQLCGRRAYRHSIIQPLPRNILPLFASDAGSMFISLIRRCTRGYAYVYRKHSTLHPDSWMEVHRHTMQEQTIQPTLPEDHMLSPRLVGLLQRTQEACQAIQARFVIMLPVGYTNEHETKRRLMHALQLTRMGIPVLRDERLGREPDRSLYADTMFHMNARGTDQNSRIIARLLKDKSYWTEQELLERMNARGFTVDDTPQK